MFIVQRRSIFIDFKFGGVYNPFAVEEELD